MTGEVEWEGGSISAGSGWVQIASLCLRLPEDHAALLPLLEIGSDLMIDCFAGLATCCDVALRCTEEHVAALRLLLMTGRHLGIDCFAAQKYAGPLAMTSLGCHSKKKSAGAVELLAMTIELCRSIMKSAGFVKLLVRTSSPCGIA